LPGEGRQVRAQFLGCEGEGEVNGGKVGRGVGVQDLELLGDLLLALSLAAAA
jgi:hypothetical protein